MKGDESDVIIILNCVDSIIPNSKSDEEEEKRLWFVSLSRARKMIYFCCPLFLELSHYKTLQKKTQNVEICDEHPKKVHSNKRINFFILTKNDLFEKNI